MLCYAHNLLLFFKSLQNIRNYCRGSQFHPQHGKATASSYKEQVILFSLHKVVFFLLSYQSCPSLFYSPFVPYSFLTFQFNFFSPYISSPCSSLPFHHYNICLLPSSSVCPPNFACPFSLFSCFLHLLHFSLFVRPPLVYHNIYHHHHDHRLIQGVPGGMDKTSGECSLC